MTYEYNYPRIASVIPVSDMWQEHAGYEETVYVKVFALVIFEELINEKISQFTLYMSHDELNYLQGELIKEQLHDSSHVADVHWDYISQIGRDIIKALGERK